MKRIKSDSIFMSSIGYYRESSILEIQFKDKQIIQYLDVTSEKFIDLIQSDSQDIYFKKYIAPVGVSKKIHPSVSRFSPVLPRAAAGTIMIDGEETAFNDVVAGLYIVTEKDGNEERFTHANNPDSINTIKQLASQGCSMSLRRKWEEINFNKRDYYYSSSNHRADETSDYDGGDDADPHDEAIYGCWMDDVEGGTWMPYNED